MKQTENCTKNTSQNRNVKVGCVIMASGSSRRFGSNKLLAEFEGKTFIGRILDNTDGLFDNTVVVTRSAEAADYCRHRGACVIEHEMPLRSDTVRLGIENMLDMDGAVFCSCDQPLLKKASLVKLIEAFSSGNHTLLRLAYEGKAGMPALFGKEWFDDLRNLPEGKGGSYILKANSDQVALVEVSSEAELFDVDTKEDLEHLKEMR